MVGEKIQFNPVWSILERSDPIKVNPIYPPGKCDNFLW